MPGVALDRQIPLPRIGIIEDFLRRSLEHHLTHVEQDRAVAQMQCGNRWKQWCPQSDSNTRPLPYQGRQSTIYYGHLHHFPRV